MKGEVLRFVFRGMLYTVTVAAMLFILGSVGALEWGKVGFLQFFLQSGGGLLAALGAYEWAEWLR